MFSTFSYQNGNMLIASKAWSDFANHIPLIRSFSLGNNFPPQYPLFSGPIIKYHFIFYAFVGLLEKVGVRIDYALNLLSILSFSFLILMIFVFSKFLFKSSVVGLLTIIFFLFNGSLTFIKFIGENLSNNIYLSLIHSKTFTSFGPYDNSIISAFWSLNIYTNQRHLALSYLISLVFIYLVIKPFIENKKENLKINFLVGIIFGLTFYINIAVFLMTGLVFAILFVLLKKFRKGIFVTIILGFIFAIPQYLLSQSQNISQISIYPGYLINSPLSLTNFVYYWFQNLGFHLIFIPLGFIVAPKKIKVILISFFSLFVIGNFIKFSPEIAANHKFFNYFMIIGAMFTSYFLIYLWKRNNYFRPLVIIFFSLLIFSGIVDFFPILNDSKIILADYKKNKDIAWVVENTKQKSIFLNTNYLYDNASVAGRKIFLGWPYFAWSQGYDTLTRDNLRKSLLSTNEKNYFCKNIKEHNINYVELNPESKDSKVNKSFFDKNFSLVYKNTDTKYFVYKIGESCL